MDPSSCSNSHFVTDNAFLQHPFNLCETPIIGFVVPLAALCILKIVINITAWKLYYVRQRIRRLKKRRIPLVPILGALVAIGYMLLLVLVSVNVAHAGNGGATALYALMSVFWGLACLLLVRKLIGFGRRLIPLATFNQPIIPTDTTSSGSLDKVENIETKLKLLNTFDFALRALFTLQLLILAATLIVGCIVNLADAPNPVWPRVVFGLVGSFAVLLVITLLYHLERLCQASYFFMTILSSHQGDGMDKLKKNIQIMRVSQVIWLGTGMFMIIPHLLIAAGILPLHWYVVILMLMIESIASTFAFCSSKPSTKARPRDGNDNEPEFAAPIVPIRIGNRMMEPTSPISSKARRTGIENIAQ